MDQVDHADSARFSPLRYLLITMGGIFLIDALAMLVLLNFDTLPYYLQIVLDAAIMVSLIFPVVYYFSFRPLLLQLEKRQQAEKSLQDAYEEMELHVQTRTEELREEIDVRKRIEQKLEQSNQKLNEILASIRDDFYVLDHDWNFVYASRLFTSKIGKEPEDFIGNSIWKMFPKHVGTVLEDNFRDAMEKREVRRFDVGGKYTSAWYRMTAFPSAEGITVLGTDITEHKQAEEALRRFELLSEHSRDIILFMRLQDGHILEANTAAIQAYGYSREELLTLTIHDLRASGTDALAAAQMDQANTRGILFETIHRCRDGRTFPVEVSSQGATIGSERVLISMVRDITERKQVEQALRRNETLLQTVLDNLPDAIYLKDLESRLLLANPATLAIIGKPAQAVLGKTDAEFYEDPASGLAIMENDRRIIDSGKTETIEESVSDPGGTRFYLSTKTPYRDADGRIIGLIGTAHDITERKRAEEALQKNEAMLRAVLNYMPSGVTVRDAFTGELILSNPRSLEILGGLVETTNQLSDYHGLHPDGRYYRSEEWPVFRSIATGEQVNSEEIEFEYGDGTHKTLSISSAPIRDAQGQIVSGVAVFHDITERKKAEQELKQLNRTLHAHNASNQAVLRVSSERELLNEVCKIIVEICGHTMVWIGYAEEDEEKSVRPVASAGLEAGYLETLKISWADTERGRGPTGMTIRTGTSHGCRNMLTDPQFAPWREQALQRGYASSLVLPLKTAGKAFGAMTIYARQTDAFSKDEEDLLTELASDLAHGIETIRLREAHERTTEALRESEERFRLALTHAPVTVAVQDRDLRYTWAYNQRTRNVNEIIGKTDVELFPLEAKHLSRLKQRVIESGENVSEQLWLHSNDQRLFLDLFIEPLKNEKGEINGIGLATVDLTEIKLAEEQLRYQATLLSNVNDAIVASDAQYRITAWNAAAETLYGWKAEEVIGRNGLEIVHTLWPEEDAAQMRGMIAEKGYWRGEATQSHKDGTRFPVDVSSMVLYDEHGQIRGYVSANRDITSIKKAEQALRAARDELERRVQERTAELAIANRDLRNEIKERENVEQQLRVQTTAMEAAASGMVITDPRGNIEWANPAMTQMSGYPAQEMIGQGMRLFQSGKHDTVFYRQLWQTILAGNVWHGETTNRHKDGNLYVEEQTITPVRDTTGQISHFISIKQDVTERKRMYAQLEESNRELTAISTAERQQRKIAETLSQASIALSQTLDIQHVMETILDYIQKVLPVDAAFLILSEGDDQYRVRCVRFRESHSLSNSLLNQTIDLLTEPAIKTFFGGQTSTLIPDSRLLEDWDPPAELAAMRSWLGLPLRSAGKTIGIVVATNCWPNAFHKDQVGLSEAVVSQATVALQNAWLFEQVRSGRQRLQLLSRHLVEVQENERKYIARELHDETSQALTSLKLGLHSIEQISDGEPVMAQQVAKLKTLADEILESIHRLAMNLRPASLDHLGLVEALTSLVEMTGERSGITARFKTLGVDQRNRLTEEIESSVYRIVQEALTNIVRHAKAAYADVILEWQDAKVTIVVEDDGIGMDLTVPQGTGRLGLVGMKERAEMLGGSLLIDSNRNTGTTLVVEIPYAY